MYKRLVTSTLDIIILYMKVRCMVNGMCKLVKNVTVVVGASDPMVRKRRRQMTGSKGKRFNEGWVEFTDKKCAKKVCVCYF